MYRKTILTVLTALICGGIASSADAAISRVAKRINVVEFQGGYALPIGSYDGIDIIDFIDTQGRLVELDADAVYDPSFYLGVNYGQLRNDHIMFSVGFRWTHINPDDTYQVDDWLTYSFVPETPSFNQYDLDFDLDYFLFNPSQTTLAPYLGFGFHGGILSATSNLYESARDFNLAVGVNFGADFAVWNAADGRSFIALSSVNEWILTASDSRVKYLNIGAALKYYFRP